MTAPADTPVAAVFMVEPGHYEWPAILLAASLRAFSQDELHLHAYCRATLIDQLRPETRATLEALGTTLAPIEPGFQVIYPQGNKLYACAAPRSAPATVLFDSDMFLLRPALLSETLREGCVSGRPTGNWMWGVTPQDWTPAYESVGLALPPARMARPDGSYTAPSVSAGYVAYLEPDFGALWRDTALTIEAKGLARGIYPTLDQISLPVAVRRAGLRLNMIDVKWNKAGKITPQALQNVVAYHYQTAETLLELPLLWLADRLIAEFTRWDSTRAMIAFYDANAARPDTVVHNAGWRETVLKPQRRVHISHKRAIGKADPK